MSDEQTPSEDVEGHKVLTSKNDEAGNAPEEERADTDDADVEGHKVEKSATDDADETDEPDVEGPCASTARDPVRH